MPTQDAFHPNHPLPVFLADQPEQQGIGRARDRASWRGLKVSILIATATAIAIAVPWAGNPANLFTNVTASLVDNLGRQPGTDQSTPKIQATADAEALPPIAKDTPTRDEIAASDPAGQDQTEKSEPSSEALFRQFQAWAAEKDAQADVRPVQPVQDTPAQVAQDAPPRVVQDARAQTENAPAQAAENAPAPLRLMQRHRHVRPVHNARAEMRVQNPRKQVRRVQNARVQASPAQDARALDARAQGQPVQNAEAPSFLQTFGLRN